MVAAIGAVAGRRLVEEAAQVHRSLVAATGRREVEQSQVVEVFVVVAAAGLAAHPVASLA